MSGHQSYIVRLLRRLESSISVPGSELFRTRLGRVVQRISRADDLRDALERLYAVEGFDRLALRLLWVMERPLPQSNLLENELMDHEVRQMEWVLRPSQDDGPAPLSPLQARPVDTFFEQLHRFGRAVEGLRRPPGEDEADADRLYRLLNATASLSSAAREAGNGRVERFCDAFSRFIHHALDERKASDVRVVNVLENANLTLQTVVESCSVQEDDTLQNMIVLLDDPRRLLD